MWKENIHSSVHSQHSTLCLCGNPFPRMCLCSPKSSASCLCPSTKQGGVWLGQSSLPVHTCEVPEFFENLLSYFPGLRWFISPRRTMYIEIKPLPSNLERQRSLQQCCVSGLPPSHQFLTSHPPHPPHPRQSPRAYSAPACQGETHKCKHVLFSSSTAGL